MPSMIPTILRFEREPSIPVIGLLRASRQPTLLDELDDRQDDVLRQLDDLNARVEALLNDWAPLQNKTDCAPVDCLANQ